MRSPEEKRAWELQCYGCAIDEFKRSIEESVTFATSGPRMCALSQLSDAQEEIERGMKENARQTINRAKWIIDTYLINGPHKRPVADPKTLQFLYDVMTTAIEGGINYWAVAKDLKRDEELNVLCFDARGEEAQDWHAINPDTLDLAIRKIQSGEVKIRRDIAAQFAGYPNNTDNCDYDAEGADCAVQIAAYGEIVYG